jgi:hypothetical protein
LKKLTLVLFSLFYVEERFVQKGSLHFCREVKKTRKSM